MRHRKKSNRFSRPRAQRSALIKSLVRAIITSRRITTTTAKAKRIRSWIEKMITWGKRGDLHSRRLAYDFLGDHALVKKLFDELAPQFEKVKGGYTRVISVGHRKGDGAQLSLIEFTCGISVKPAKKSKVVRPAKETDKDTKSASVVAPSVAAKEKNKPGIASGVKKIFKKGKKNP